MSQARALDSEHARPDGASDAEVEAAGKMSEALEVIERVRGHLYSMHQLMGEADFTFGDACDLLETAGHPELAERVRTELVGRNLLDGRWTFQIVEEFDDGYYADAKAHEQQVRQALMAGRRHVYEAEMKQRRRTAGDPRHTATP